MSTTDDQLHAMMNMVSKLIETQVKAFNLDDDIEVVIVAAMRGVKHVSVASVGRNPVALLRNALDNADGWKDVTDDVKAH